MKIEDYYGILQVSRYASQEEIKEAYLRLSDMYISQTGDLGQSKFMLCLIEDAYETLANPEEKEAYDMEWDVVYKNPRLGLNAAMNTHCKVQREEISGASLEESLNNNLKPTNKIETPKNEQKRLLAYINVAFLENSIKTQERSQTEGRKMPIKGLYGLFLEDQTFQFVYEMKKNKFLKPTYYLCSALGRNRLTGDYTFEERPWGDYGVPMNINAQNGFVIPADRLIPIDRILDGCVSTSDMVYVSKEITKIILAKPKLLNEYFRKPTIESNEKRI